MPETEYVYVLSEEEERAALTGATYVPTAEDLDVQAAADRDQEQAERDYHELARLALFAAKCRCGGADCLPCRCRKWLAAGL